MNVHFMSQTWEWATPKKLFDELNAEFRFTLNPCCTDENAKTPRHYTRQDDGLSQDWAGEIVFMNPPYGRVISKWMKKAFEAQTVVVCLIPCRTDTAWWHEYAMKADEIRFIRGRVHFNDSKSGAPFPSAIVIFGRRYGLQY
jgi:phage N-6-adenine-methyltransferase